MPNYQIDQKTGKIKVKITEKDLTKAIRSELKLLNIWHFKVHQGLGSVKGIPDIIACVSGVLLGIEVKTDRGKVTDHQRQQGSAIRRSGGAWIVARNVETVRSAIKIIYGRGKGSQGGLPLG